MTKIEFIEWLKREIESRNWSQAEFARQTNLSPAQVTRLLNGERGVGENGINSIAHAFKLPPETVFRAAGLLPQQTPENETIEQISHLTKELPAYEQNDILEFVKMRHDPPPENNSPPDGEDYVPTSPHPSGPPIRRHIMQYHFIASTKRPRS